MLLPDCEILVRKRLLPGAAQPDEQYVGQSQTITALTSPDPVGRGGAHEASRPQMIEAPQTQTADIIDPLLIGLLIVIAK